MTPEFPIRIIFDDGECTTLESPDELIREFDTVDSAVTAGRIWIRDALDRTVVLKMRGGFVETLETVE